MSDAKKSFSLREILPRQMMLKSVGPTDGQFSIKYNIQANIVSDQELRLVFGLWMESKKKVSEILPEGDSFGDFKAEHPAQTVLVELEAKIETDMQSVYPTSIHQIPLIANMLAIMYPFVRERVYSMFLSVQTPIILNAVNINTLLNGLKKSGNSEVIDSRAKIIAGEKP